MTVTAKGYDYAVVIMIVISNHSWMESECVISAAPSTSTGVTICTRWFWWGRFETQAFCWHKHWQMHSVFLQGDGRQSHTLCRWMCRSLRQLYGLNSTSVRRESERPEHKGGTVTSLDGFFDFAAEMYLVIFSFRMKNTTWARVLLADTKGWLLDKFKTWWC